ncbi:MAG: hypothetical protein J7M34_03210 [Anaerolineae bacterium]|nr:hypothetical protein [Anaerolineae bacterium]
MWLLEESKYLMRGCIVHDGGEDFVEFAVILILIAIVVLAVLLILGDDLRVFINGLLQAWFPPR